MSRANQEAVQVGSKKLQPKIKTILAKWNALEILIGLEIGYCTLGKTTNQKQFGVEVITNNQEENY